MLNITMIDHLNFTVRSFDQTQSFYQKIFGFELLQEGRNMSGDSFKIIGLKGRFALCLSENEEQISEGGFNHFGINIANFDDILPILEKNNVHYQYGGAVDYEKSRSIYITDPDGYEIELSETPVGGL